MKRSGSADLPLHYGKVPSWLAERMARLGLAVSTAIIQEEGPDALLRRLSNPYWFQSLGAVMGMDWHSSGITTSVMGALKKALQPHANELGIYICGGKGKLSRDTPTELIRLGDKTGLDATALVRCSQLSAKVDNTLVQDGFQLYTHHFIASRSGQWTVVQQGMNAAQQTARRYHWHSAGLQSFVEEPHTGICGINQGTLLNLTAAEASSTRTGIFGLTQNEPMQIIQHFQRLVMPAHHEVYAKDVNLKRLGAVLWLAHEQHPENFEALLSLPGVGPRTIQSLTLVSEVIYGTPSRFTDPARFSFAHGGKDGHPFPVPLKVYDETIQVLERAVAGAKIHSSEKSEAIKKLHSLATLAEKNFIPNQQFDQLIEKERRESWRYGGQTVMGKSLPPVPVKGKQLALF